MRGREAAAGSAGVSPLSLTLPHEGEGIGRRGDSEEMMARPGSGGRRDEVVGEAIEGFEGQLAG